jgi:Fic family protein
LKKEETTYRIEPCHLDSYPGELVDIISEIVSISAVLGSRLHPLSAMSLAKLVRVMNCYYSNLIEGHYTRPRDIERAFVNDLEADGERRELQLEARAHIRVQSEIDHLFINAQLGEPAACQFIKWLHREFYKDASDRMLCVNTNNGVFQMQPGEFRSEPKHDNVVGRHHPPSSIHVKSFMQYFEQRYRMANLGRANQIAAIAAAHHRLNYIHPFIDGNGRVSRLVAHAMALKAGIGAYGLWSISRGLARGIEDRGEYKRMMDLADSPRRGDLDGRGNLSHGALIDFITWFCRVSLDQLRFMSDLFDLDTLINRLHDYVINRLGGTEDAFHIVREVFRRGEIPRGEVAHITGRSERTAREQLRHLIDAELLGSSTPKGPVSLRFSSVSAEDLFPRLFPAQRD